MLKLKAPDIKTSNEADDMLITITGNSKQMIRFFFSHVGNPLAKLKNTFGF